MLDAEYTRIRQMPLSDLRQLGVWEFARYFESCTKFQRKMILLALGAE
jgi:hypothetical protein